MSTWNVGWGRLSEKPELVAEPRAQPSTSRKSDSVISDRMEGSSTEKPADSS